jgi:hypothetical protein
MLSSEKEVKSKQFKYAWSVALDQAGYRVQYTGARDSRMSEIIAQATRPWDDCLNEQVFALPTTMIYGIL